MTVGELFGGTADISAEISGIEVSGVTSDTREMEEGFLYVCIKGNTFDGHSAAAQMLEKGAAAVVTQHAMGLPREITAEDTRRLYPELLSAFYGRPTERIKLCAVTGTNGKTTVVNLCAGILRGIGIQTGVIGTVGCDTGRGLVYSHDGPPTTPEPRRLYQLFREMADIGTEYCFIEASSQALAQHRFAAERFRAAAFTNLTQDHLDYHGDMESYYLAKRSLFDMCGTAVINIDDEYGRRTAGYCRDNGIRFVSTSVYGEAEYYTETVRLSPHRADFILTDKKAQKSYPASIPMTGYYNVSNAVQAAVICASLGFDMADCLEALGKISGVSGRLETLYAGEFTVIRDYAHTADALEKLLSALRPAVKGRLICLFGAAGERDAGKRPDMGAAASRYADYLVITSDNPRHEDMQSIIDGVKQGVPRGVPLAEFTDRKDAIYHALGMARAGDLIALCGKGHEDYQAVGDEYLHFDEKEITENWIEENGL